MKAIPLWQPFAQLVVCGAKKIETRHWCAPPALIGERIAIYATRRKSELHLCREEPFSTFVPDLSVLPLGAIVGTAIITKSVEMTNATISELDEPELSFGWYVPGRFAWHLDAVEPIEAIPFVWPHRGPAKWVHVPDRVLAGALA